MDPRLSKYPLSTLKRIRDELAGMGADVSNLDNEIASRQGSDILTQASPDIAKAKVDTAVYGAERTKYEAQGSRLENDPAYIGRMLNVREQNAKSLAKQAENKANDVASNTEHRKTLDELKREKQTFDLDPNNWKAGAKDSKEKLEMKFKARDGVIDNVSKIKSDILRLNSQIKRAFDGLELLSQDNKAEGMREYNDLIAQRGNLYKEIEGQNQLVQKYDEEFRLRGIVPTTGPAVDGQPTSQPSPAVPSPTSQPSPAVPSPTSQPGTYMERVERGDGSVVMIPQISQPGAAPVAKIAPEQFVSQIKFKSPAERATAVSKIKAAIAKAQSGDPAAQQWLDSKGIAY